MLQHVNLSRTLHIQTTTMGKLRPGRVWYWPTVTTLIGKRWGLGNMDQSVSTTPDSRGTTGGRSPLPTLCVSPLVPRATLPCTDRPILCIESSGRWRRPGSCPREQFQAHTLAKLYRLSIKLACVCNFHMALQCLTPASQSIHCPRLFELQIVWLNSNWLGVRPRPRFPCLQIV